MALTWHGPAWHGPAWHGPAWHGPAWHGPASHGPACYSPACYARPGTAWRTPTSSSPRSSATGLPGGQPQLPSSAESCSVIPATEGNLARHFSSSATSALLAWLIR